MPKLIFQWILLVMMSHPAFIADQEACHVDIHIPTVEEEALSIWRTINDINFLEEQGYKIHLPNHKTISALIRKSKEGRFGNDDFSSIYQILEHEVYDMRDYSKALSKAKQDQVLIEHMLNDLSQLKSELPWEFYFPGKYEIVFTLYGTGGSYDVENARVTLFTDQQGNFMNYENPVNTIIHEIVHIGIETSLVQKFDLIHGDKERLVDSIVKMLFAEKLPEYRIQNMGDPIISEKLVTIDNLKEVEETLQELQN